MQTLATLISIWPLVLGIICILLIGLLSLPPKTR